MRKGTLRSLVDQHVQEAGSNTQLGWENAASQVDSLIQEGKVKPSDFSILACFEELVDPQNNMNRNTPSDHIAEAVRTSAFPTLTKVIINRQIMDSYNLYVGDAANLVSEAEATRTTNETFGGFTSGEGLEMRPEGHAYEETTFGEKDYGAVMADFGRIISLTREAIFEDRTGQLLERAREIGEKGGQHRAKMIIQTLEVAPRTAFKEKANASKAFIYKGTARQASVVYASSHTSLDGVVNDNLATTNALADWTDIQNALLKFDSMVDETGDPIEIDGANQLLVPTALKVTAWTILNTGITGVKGSTDAVNIPTRAPFGAQGMQDFSTYSSRYLSNSTTWYLGNFRKQLVWLWVFKPETATQTASSESAFSNQIIQRYRFSYHGGCGHRDYRYIVKNTA